MSGVVHCMQAPYDVYAGRGRDPHTGEMGELGNQFTHRPSRVPGVIVVSSLEEAIACHRRWVWEQIRSGAIELEWLAALAGLTFGCWCRQPGPCHAHNWDAAAMWAAAQLRR